MFILKASVAIFVLIHVIVVIYRRYNNLYFKTTELLLSGKNAKIWGDFCESVWDICDKARFGDYLALSQMSQTDSQKSSTSFSNTSTADKYFEPKGLLS